MNTLAHGEASSYRSFLEAGDRKGILAWILSTDHKRIGILYLTVMVTLFLVATTIGDGTASIRMQKGAIASIRLDDGPGQPGDLEWLATPDIFGF